MTPAPIWERDGRDWPNRASSRFVRAGGLLWHVQEMGGGPTALLVHGTGAATHSWRGLAPILARRFTVLAPDLPGHGFTEMPPARTLSLPGMAGALGALLRALGASPALAVGHSAGAAILARMCLDGAIAPRALIGLNAALAPLRGAHAPLFPAAARLLFGLPVVPALFAWRAADRARVEQLMRGTGSQIDPLGLRLYARLARSPGHVRGALGMMAHWDLEALARDLPRLRPPPVLLTGGNDRMIAPADAARVRELVPGTRLMSLPGLGHLAHEERPEEVAALVEAIAREAGVLSPEEAGA